MTIFFKKLENYELAYFLPTAIAPSFDGHSSTLPNLRQLDFSSFFFRRVSFSLSSSDFSLIIFSEQFRYLSLSPTLFPNLSLSSFHTRRIPFSLLFVGSLSFLCRNYLRISTTTGKYVVIEDTTKDKSIRKVHINIKYLISIFI